MSRQPVTGGRAVVDALIVHGVDTVFGIPGTHNLAIYSAIRESSLTHVTTRHEQGAGYGADGYARVTGRPGIVVTTTGPAILNAAAAAAQAYSDSIPVLFVAPGMPLRHPSGHNGLLHEVRSQFDAMAAVVGHAQRVTSVEEIPQAVDQCFSAMVHGRPRPAYLEIPLDLLEETAEVFPARPCQGPVISPTATSVSAAVELLAGAERPLIIAGGGANAAENALLAFASQIDAPVITSANGKGVLSEGHPLALGAGVHLRAALDLVRDSDLVIAVGTELAPADWWWGPPTPRRLIRIDIDSHSIGTNASADVALVGDAGHTLTLLTATALEHPTRAETGPSRANHWRRILVAESRTIGEPWVGLCEALERGLSNDAVVIADQSMSCYYGLLSNLPRFVPRSFCYPAGLGTLGYSLPAGIGAKVAQPQREVVTVIGDGGIMFAVAELATAAQLRLPLPVVVVDNGGYGEIRNEMMERDGAAIAVDLPGPDFPMLAASLGCYGVAANSYAEVGPAVREALSADRPTVIHVREDVRT